MHEYALNESVRTNVIVIRGSVTPEQAREFMVFLGRKKRANSNIRTSKETLNTFRAQDILRTRPSTRIVLHLKTTFNAVKLDSKGKYADLNPRAYAQEKMLS